MTYPPQQPGPPGWDPYGQQQPGQYGQQPTQYGQYGQQPGQYGQFGQPGYPGGEPPKSRTGMIVAVVVIAVLVLGGAGVGIYFLTKEDDPGTGASGNQTSESRRPDPTSGKPRPTSSRSTRSTTTTRSSARPTGGSEQELKETADDYAAAVNSSDKAKATDLTCDKTGPGVVYDELAGQVEVEVGKIEMLDDESALVDITLKGGSSASVPLPFDFKSDAWCVTV